MQEQSHELKRVCEALFSQYDQTARADVERMQQLLSPRAVSKSSLSDTTAVYRHSPEAKKDCSVLVSAHSTYITPSGQKWFNIRSRDRAKNPWSATDAVSKWFSKATEITNDELSESNFYTCIQEVYNDRCQLGTGCAFIGGSETEPLHFIHVPMGTFAIAEDNKHVVNTLVRRFNYTAQQAADEWGFLNLPEKVKDDYMEPSRRYTEKRTYVHLVRPRRKAYKGMRDIPSNLREYEGFYMDEESYTVIKEEGYFEFPFLVTRFIRGNDSPYGEPPGLTVEPTIRQLMKLERLMDAMGEKAAFPPILQLAKQNMQVDMRAGAINTIDPESARLGYPRELASQSRYDAGLERINAKKEEIKAAYFVDMLNAISVIERQMTATEINAREAEKVLAFSPSFTLFIVDFQPAMRRIMAILMRQEKLPEDGKPAELFVKSPEGRLMMLNPQVSYMGKIAQAVERVQQRGTNQVVEAAIAFDQGTGTQTMTKLLKPRVIMRGWIEANGAPSDIMIDDAEYEQMQAAEQMAAQQQMDAMQQQQSMDTMATAAGAIQQLQAARRK